MKKLKLKRKKLCECGCEQEVIWNKKGKRWNRFINHHNSKCFLEETKEKMSKSHTGIKLGYIHRKNISKAHKGRKKSKEHLLKIGISRLRCNIDGYCDAWSDRGFKKDIRLPYCEMCGISRNLQFKLFGRGLSCHHKDGNKKNCCLSNIQTLCSVCHGRIGNGWKAMVKANTKNVVVG